MLLNFLKNKLGSREGEEIADDLTLSIGAQDSVKGMLMLVCLVLAISGLFLSSSAHRSENVYSQAGASKPFMTCHETGESFACYFGGQ